MIVGVDARAAAEVPAGRGRVVRELLLAWNAMEAPHRFLLFCRKPWDEGQLGSSFEWVRIGANDPLWHVAAAVRASHRCDVFLSTNSYLTAWMLRVPCAIVVHDLIAFIPEVRPQGRAASIEKATIGPAVRRAAKLVCNSRSTERDLLKLFPRAAGKTGVVTFAADSRFDASRTSHELQSVARKHGVSPGGFVLAVGTLEPRKNLVRLIRAHSALPSDLRSAHPLLVVGPTGWQHEEIIATAGEAAEVMVGGWVSDEELACLYAACTAFCYPSLYEGFGLPVLEAMRAGAPTITSNVSSLPEVGGDAVVYVDPLDEDSIREALERLLRSADERSELAERGRERAGSFSWEQAARGLLTELDQAASTRS